MPANVPLTWNGFVTNLANMAVVQTTTTGNITVGVDPAFNTLLPTACSYSENRIQRDLNLLPMLTTGNYTLVPGLNILALGAADFVTVDTVGVQVNGALNPLLPVTKEWLQTCYGDPSYLAQPTYFAMYGGDTATGGQVNNNVLLGPYPDINYPALVTGTQRMSSLYNSATQALANSGLTWISTWLPDLFLQAAMIPVMEFQRDFGASGSENDAQGPGTYEAQYQKLLNSAIVEEARKRFNAQAWSSQGPTPVATADR
jgi:hypothetical protein